MKVILLSDVSKLGSKGDLIDVAEGYGRNFLVPRKMAEEATREKLEEWQQRQKARENRARREEQESLANRDHLQGKQVILKATAGEKGKLFGSVTVAQIAEQLNSRFGVKIDKKEIKLSTQIKEVGSYPFSVRLHPGVEAEMTVLVEAEKRE